MQHYSEWKELKSDRMSYHVGHRFFRKVYTKIGDGWYHTRYEFK